MFAAFQQGPWIRRMMGEQGMMSAHCGSAASATRLHHDSAADLTAEVEFHRMIEPLGRMHNSFNAKEV
jgi:hypothetical protein